MESEEKLEKKEKKEKCFYAINMHGFEKDEILTIPKGIRIIMYCYSGEQLWVNTEFNQFIWEEILLNPSATKDYDSLLMTLYKHKMFRDHFCIYEEGDKVKNILFTTDPSFRDGIFSLPVKASVYDGENTIYVSNHNIFPKTIRENIDVKRVVVNREKVSKYISYKGYQTLFFSRWKIPLKETSLKSLIEQAIALQKNCTFILFTCRESQNQEKDSRISLGKTVFSEVKKKMKINF